MSLLHVDFFSSALKQAMSMDVLLPERPQYPTPAPRRDYPVLYLLHGLSDDHTIWQRRTRIESYVSGRDLIVVMPSTHRAFYTNTVSGYKYFDYIAYEIPAFCKANFPVAEGRENTYVAGLSMGGYGALKLAMTLPENYSAAACLSGAIDLVGMRKRHMVVTETDEFDYVFGRPRTITGSEHDIFALTEKLLADPAKPKPRIYMACGLDDGLLRDSRLFKRRYGRQFDFTYEEGAGSHNWDFWDQYIQKVLAWL
ncbi:MAG: alpha/beta hydrolase [Eubacteriales bacterium]|jgi:putative tributyrin esterase